MKADLLRLLTGWYDTTLDLKIANVWASGEKMKYVKALYIDTLGQQARNDQTIGGASSLDQQTCREPAAVTEDSLMIPSLSVTRLDTTGCCACVCSIDDVA